IGAPTHALRFKRQVPATLVFIQPTQEQVHLIMPLALDMGCTPAAGSALALVNHLGWHPASSSLSASCPHSTATAPLTGSPQNPEVIRVRQEKPGQGG